MQGEWHGPGVLRRRLRDNKLGEQGCGTFVYNGLAITASAIYSDRRHVGVATTFGVEVKVDPRGVNPRSFLLHGLQNEGE